MSSRWDLFKTAMLAETGRDFERVALPFLRIAWPDLGYPKDLGFFDCQGIDQLVVKPGGVFPVVIQFKGFEILSQFGKSQLDQVRDSIDAFINSGQKTDIYILFYNRRGEDDQTFHKAVGGMLGDLVTAGVATTPLVWSIDDAAKFLKGELDARVRERMLDLSNEKKRERASPFLFGDVLLKEVPFRDAMWTFGKGIATELGAYSPLKQTGLRSLVTDSTRKVRWSMIVGPFGIGKTTLALTLGDDAGIPVIYIPAARLRHLDTGGAGESKLWRELAAYLEIIEDFAGIEGIDLHLANMLIAESIGRLMRGGSHRLILVIDGLDENRHYSKINGLKLLVNELAHIQIDVVLTTRREHFYDAYGNYKADFAAMSGKNSSKPAHIIELADWDRTLCSAFLDAAAATLPAGEQTRLVGLKQRIERGELAMVSSHPLWLSMAAELALGPTMPDFDDLFPLYEAWTAAKLARDYGEPRSIPAGFDDNLSTLVECQQALMTQVAAHMIDADGDAIALVEEVDESVVAGIARELFDGRVASQSYAVTSLMELIAPRSAGSPKTLRFFHASLHEYYVARWLRQGGKAQREMLSKVALSEEIRRFMPPSPALAPA